MSKLIPDGWQVTHLEKSLDILSGFPFKSEKFTDDRSKIGLIRIRDLTKQSVDTFYDDAYGEEYVVRRGDILIGMDGDFNIVKWNSQAALLNQRICKIAARKEKGFDTNFLFYSLVPELDSIHKATGATTVKHLSVKDIRQIERPFPPLPEQQQIAAILTAVDDVIESTQAQINKLKDLKTGMMQELLTKGIGHTEFKDSPVGRIPFTWQISNLNEIFEIKHGYPFDGQHFTSELQSHILLTPGNFHRDGHLYFGEKTKYYAGPILDDYVLRNGDLLVVMTDLTKEMTILGNAIELHSAKPVLHNQRIGKVSIIDYAKIQSNFACLALNSEIVKRHVRDTATGTTVRHTSPSRILEPSIALPSLDEQRLIVEIIESVNTRLEVAKLEMNKSQELKKALMQDLLTGKVRVNIT